MRQEDQARGVSPFGRWVVLIGAGLAVTLWAGGDVAAAERRTLFGANVSLGIGPGLAPDYEGSDDYEAVAVPYARLDWGRRYVQLRGLELKANLRTHDHWEFGPIINYRREAFDDASDDRVKRLQGDGDAVEVGPFLGWKNERWDGAVQITKDVADGHQGWLTQLEAGYSTTVGAKTRLRFGVETTYATGDYMNDYFGVDAANARRSGLPEFDADKGFRDVGANLRAFYDLSQRWTLSGILNYNRLLNDAKDSPVVDDRGDENQYFVGLLGIYHF